MFDGDITPPGPIARLDEPAPRFEARATSGIVRLDDHRGRWVVLFAHPADFTPVCTSEFVALSKASGDFAKLGCDLIGLSVDSVSAHLAWLERIEADFGVRPSFPLMEDPSVAISRAYGMVHPGASTTATVRSVFVVDPGGILRAIVHSTEDGEGVAGEGWREGDALLTPAPETAAAMADGRDATSYAGVSS